MYKIIGINYERATSSPSVIIRQGRSKEVLDEVYKHGKRLWDNGDCSKYLVALIRGNKIVDYNRPDSWNFENKNNFDKETGHFSTWDYEENPCPYKDRPFYEGEMQEHLKRYCVVYTEILIEEGVEL